MGVIKYKTLDFSTIPIPAIDTFVVGYDLDGLLKQKDSAGIVTIFGDTTTVSPQKSYVSTIGNDLTAVNYSIKKPYATVEAAIMNAVSGDVVYVTAGSYGVSGNIYQSGVILFLEKGATLYVSSTISVGDGGIFVVRGEGSIYNFTPLFEISSFGTGSFDVELEHISAFDALCFTYGSGIIKLKAKDVKITAANSIIIFGTSEIDFNIDLVTNSSGHSCIFIYNTSVPAMLNYNYIFKIGKLINSSSDYGALHMELSHEKCFVNWTGDIEHNNFGGGFMNGALTASGTSGTHGAIVKFVGNINTNQYGTILSSAGLRVDMVGDIISTGSRPAITIAGSNRPTLQLRGNVSGTSSDDMIHLGIVDVFTQSATEGFFKHISGKLLQNNISGNSVIIKEGSTTECVVGGELMTMNPTGFALYTASTQDVYSLNASTNGDIAVGFTTFGSINSVTGVPEIDF